MIFKFSKVEEDCKSCEILKEQLNIVNAERAELLDTILGLVKPEVLEQNPIPIEPIRPKTVPWRIREQMLRNEDKEKFRILQEEAKRNQQGRTEEIDKLEKELGLGEENAG